MDPIINVTLQEIGHNSGDVVSEEVVECFDAAVLFPLADEWMARNPRLDWAAALRIAACQMRNRARRA